MKKAGWVLAIAFALGSNVGWSQSAAVATAAAKQPEAVSGVLAVVILKSSLSSKDAKEGQVVKATVRRAVTLSDGHVIARDAELTGTVVKASKHTKALPNGVLELTFDHVTEKGQPSSPVAAWLARLDPDGTAASAEDATAAERAAQKKANADAAKKAPMATGLPGVMMQVTKEASGTVFALGEDVYLDRGIEMTVLLAPAPAAK